MPSDKKKMESMLFDYRTTYLTSYRPEPIPEVVQTEYRDRKSTRPRPAPLSRDTHTLTPWKTTIPFCLLHKPKDVVRTNPNVVQQRYESPVDVDREQSQRTRPRLVMTPAVSLDDVADARARELLCRAVYCSDTAAGLRAAAPPCRALAAPLPGPPAPSNPIALPKLQPPAVPAEWRMNTVAWDGRQLRGHCDPTKDFWLRQEVPKCRACAEFAIIESHRTRLRKMKR